MISRSGVEDTTFEAKAKTNAKVKDRLFEDKPSRGQEQEWVEAKAKDRGLNFLIYDWQIFHYF